MADAALSHLVEQSLDRVLVERRLGEAVAHVRARAHAHVGDGQRPVRVLEAAQDHERPLAVAVPEVRRAGRRSRRMRGLDGARPEAEQRPLERLARARVPRGVAERRQLGGRLAAALAHDDRQHEIPYVGEAVTPEDLPVGEQRRGAGAAADLLEVSERLDAHLRVGGHEGIGQRAGFPRLPRHRAHRLEGGLKDEREPVVGREGHEDPIRVAAIQVEDRG